MLEGQYYLFQNTDEALVRKVESFARATELDPEYAEPHFGLAQHYLILALFFHMRPRDAMPKALASAERALELDPTDWRGYYVRSVVRATLDYDWTGAAWAWTARSRCVREGRCRGTAAPSST